MSLMGAMGYVGGLLMQGANRSAQYNQQKKLQESQIKGHNIIAFDIPVLEKLYPSRKFTHNVLDTFNLSYIQFPQRNKHGLEDWGKDLGYEKFNPMTGKEYTDEEWKERKKTKSEAWDKYTPEMGAYCQQDVRVTELVLRLS